MVPVDIRAMAKYRDYSRFRLTFAPQVVNLESRIRGAGLAGKFAFAGDRQYSALQIRESVIGEFLDLFGVKIEHVLCASVRRCFSVLPHKTGALERVLQATGRYSMRRWGSDAPSTTTSWSKAHLSLAKAPEGTCGGAVVKMSREVVYAGGVS